MHRAALAEVFLTGWQRRTEDRFTLSAQWSRSHGFFTTPSRTHHVPQLVAETIRQAVFVLAHAEFGIPLGDHFVMSELYYRTSLSGLEIGPAPTEVRLEAVCSDLRRRGVKTVGFRCDLTLHQGGRVIAAGGGAFTAITPRVYRRLRAGRRSEAGLGGKLPAPVAPQLVGRSSPLDVVLAPTAEPHVWQLRADTAHPTMFDHPVDHVPGMVLIEAACQAAAARVHPRTYHALSLFSEFHRYVEHGSPCFIAVENGKGGREGTPAAEAAMRVTGRQGGELVYEATLRAYAEEASFTPPRSSA